MKKLLTWLSKRRFPYEPLITISISKERLFHNLDEFRKLAPGRQIAPVLKSNAYGHGLFEIAKLLEQSDALIPFFIVDSYFEAVALRSKGVKTPLLIIGYTRPETILASRIKQISFTITNFETLQAIQSAKQSIRLHLKINTGMNRQGVAPEEVPAIITLLKSNHCLTLEGVCSHLSDADNPEAEFTLSQITTWNSLVKKISSDFPGLKYKHLGATDGHLFTAQIDANVSRLGLGLYGIPETSGLKKQITILPVLEMQTIITGIRTLKKGDHVGYGKTFTADRDMTIATIPVGYFEGLDRSLSGKGCVQVGPDRVVCPIVGRVSMNITTIDVTGVDAKINSPVVVISKSENDPNSIHGMVQLSGRIPYEHIVRLPEHLKRIVVD